MRVAFCVPQGTAVVVLPPSSIVVRITMDLFQHRYYRLSKILMILIGQWPYQSTCAKRGFRAVLFVLTTSVCVPEILVVAKYRHDWRILLECLFLYVFFAICVMRLLNFMWNSQKRLKLINLIRTDWQLWAQDREVNILHGYAEQGEKITIVYTAMMYSTVFIFMTQPMIPKIVDLLMKNGTAVGEFPYPVVYYHIDEQKYYFHLIMYSLVCAWSLSTILISNDVILIIYVQHICGIFAALGHKLQRILDNDTSVKTGEDTHALSKRDMVCLASCIVRHNDAIEYANLIQGSYTRTFFFTVGLGVILINGAGLQVLMRTGNPETTTRFIVTVLGILVYFYIECYFSQILMDHSIGIRFYIYNSQWYRLSPKAQKFLLFMMMRCTVPCQLTAGKIMTLSVRNFWLTVKTSISYFGVLRSTQGV